jgi:hypothetical protein
MVLHIFYIHKIIKFKDIFISHEKLEIVKLIAYTKRHQR